MNNKLPIFLCLIFLSIGAFSQNIPAYVPTNGLVGYWPFNGNANDESGNGNHGMVNGATLTSDRNGVAGNAFSFNGVNCCGTADLTQEIEINRSLVNLQNNFSVSIWMSSSNILKYQQCLFNSINHTGFAVELNNEHVPNRLTYGVGPANAFWDLIYAQGNSINYSNNIWYHVVFIKSGLYYYLYLNSNLDGSSNVPNSINYNQNIGLRIGSIGGGHEVFKGKLDDVGIWNRALTQQEITALYTGAPPCTPTSSTTNLSIPSTSLPYTWNGLTFNNSGSQTATLTNAKGCDSTATLNLTINYILPNYIPTNGLVGYWPFNGNANDESGNGNHGTVNGATLTSDRKNNNNGCFSFSNHSQYIQINGLYQTNINEYTISVWFKKNPGTPSQSGSLVAGSSCNPSPVRTGLRVFAGTDNKLYYSAESQNCGNGVGSGTAQFSPSDGVWHHFTAVFNSPQGSIQPSAFTIYIDGNLVAQNKSAQNYSNLPISPINNQNLSLIIGNSTHFNDHFPGFLDDIAIYNRALTQQEITALYTGVTPCTPTSSTTNLSISSTSLPYTWNGLTFNNSGSQTATLSNASGCDSTATLNLIVNYTLPTYVPTNGLVGYWPFNGNANDESGNGNHGTVYGAILTNDRSGNNNKAFNFNGSSKINIQHSNSLIVGNEMTLSVWFKQSIMGNTTNYILQKGTGGGCVNTGYYSAIDYGGGSVPNGVKCLGYGINSNSCGSIGSDIAIKASEWHSMIIVYAPQTQNKIYIDGTIISNPNWSACNTCTISNSSTPLILGALYSSNGGNNWNGDLDDISIYNRALTQQEITQLYTGTVTHSIDASSEANGTITPSGSTSVNSGTSQTYIFTPNPGYWIDSVIVNGIKVPTASSYTFSNVSSNQSIRVTYRSLAAALAAANICANDTTVATVNLPATSLVRATTYYSNIYLFNQNNTGNAYKYNVNDRKYTAIADKPTPCVECGVAAANGKVYCFNTNGTTQAYDIASNTWQTQTNQPNSSTSSVYAVSINNKVYVLGANNNNQNTFTQYNPLNNTYTAQASPNQPTSQSRLVAYNNLIYKIGGINTTTNTTSTVVEVYNPSNNTWTNLPDLPEALSHIGASNYDNKLYVFGGKQSTASNSSNSNKVYVFDIAGNSWYAQGNILNFQRANIEAKTANGLVYLFGGTDSSNTATNQANRYFCKDQLCTCKWSEYVCNGQTSDIPCTQLSPSINSLSQDTTANTGSLYSGTSAINTTVTLNYTGANGANYNARTIVSTGVTGLTATLAAGTLNNGNGSLILNITGTPNTNGTASFTITIGRKTCVFTREVKTMPYRAGTVFCNGVITEVVEVTNPITGRTWMDRNLGASRAATSSTDSLAYGDLYQWGRGADGHQCRNSATTTTLSSTDQPGHGNFILISPSNSSYDWRTPQNDNLWQGVNGINNPCPTGYRLPTNLELEAERISWTENNSFGAINSKIKFTRAGSRYINGGFDDVGGTGYYWGISIIGYFPYLLQIEGGITYATSNFDRSFGMTVRCIKDYPASIGSLDTIGSINQGNLTNGIVANNVTIELKYTSGNGAMYEAQTIASTGITGLTANLAAGNLNNGDGTLIFNITGTPNSYGIANFSFSIGGKTCVFTREVKTMPYRAGTVFCNGVVTEVVEVTNPITGKTWMDRNLGASRAATNITDSLAYGDLYQWGRGADGHQCRNSDTTSVLSTSDQPGHGNFILISSSNSSLDWRTPQNNNLWQGLNGVNNPCPSGYKLPTYTELDAERNSWTQDNIIGAFSSPLRLIEYGHRLPNDGWLDIGGGSSGYYWSSNVDGSDAWFLQFNSNSYMGSTMRSQGFSVRCIKDYPASIGSLDTIGSINQGVMYSGISVSNISTTLNYKSANGAMYEAQTIASTGATGLTATLAAGNLNNGDGTLIFNITGTPNSYGIANFSFSIGGKTCVFTRNILLTGDIDSLFLDSILNTSDIYEGISTSNFTVRLNYISGNGGSLSSKIFQSYDVTGLTASMNDVTLNNGNGKIIINIAGIPSQVGYAKFNISIGNKIYILSIQIKSLTIGMNFQGGILAYILQPGDLGYQANTKHGLIVTPNDLGIAKWGCNGTLVQGTSQNLGSGNSNTKLIINTCPENNIAALICSDLILNGFDDWFLPSVMEFQKIFPNKNLIGGFQNALYIILPSCWTKRLVMLS